MRFVLNKLLLVSKNFSIGFLSAVPRIQISMQHAGPLLDNEQTSLKKMPEGLRILAF